MADIRHYKGSAIDLDEIKGLAMQGGSKIQLIKHYRAFTGAGLKESKDAIDRGSACGTDGIIYEFTKLCIPKTITKEQFMGMIENAIDNMDIFYCDDMTVAVQTLLDNIKTRGGMEAVALEYERFIDAI